MSAPALDRESARRIARLSRLELCEEELERYAGQLDAILRYVSQLEALDLDGVEGTSHADPRARGCPLREDEPGRSLPREALLAAAPAQDGEHFLVPRMIGHE